MTGVRNTHRGHSRKLEEYSFIYSMSRKGNPYGNAAMESFCRTLKRELINGERFGTKIEARQEVFEYIELYYNTKRTHSALGYVSPVDYEREKTQNA